MAQVKIIVERHDDGFLAYPLGLKGVVIGEGNTYEEAVDDVTSAILFHIETFGDEMLDDGDDVRDVYVSEASVPH